MKIQTISILEKKWPLCELSSNPNVIYLLEQNN